VREAHEFLTQADTGVAFAFSEPWLKCPALPPCPSSELMKRLGAAIDSVVGVHEFEAVPYGTDASSLALAGIPSVVFGPGDIAQAHTADEWIELQQVEQAAEILFRFVTSN
jgi:acetylornithine deacetylase